MATREALKSGYIARAARSTCAGDKDAAIEHLADLLAWITSCSKHDRDFAKERIRELARKGKAEWDNTDTPELRRIWDVYQKECDYNPMLVFSLGDKQKDDPANWITTVNDIMEGMILHDIGTFPPEWWPDEE